MEDTGAGTRGDNTDKGASCKPWPNVALPNWEHKGTLQPNGQKGQEK